MQEANAYWLSPILMCDISGMNLPEEARAYLDGALRRKHVTLAEASRAIGRSHAYLQQYITRGKPRWLSESDRAGLVRLYELDDESLKPPPADLALDLTPAALSGNRHDQSKIDAPRRRKVIDDPRELQLLDTWGKVPEDRRILALRILQGLVDEALSIGA